MSEPSHERIYVLDSETTGLEPSTDRVVELALVEIDGARTSGRVFHWLINPECHIPGETTSIHGIRDVDVANSPVFAEVADELLEIIRGSTVMAHNATFDVNFLNAELQRCRPGRTVEAAATVIDTLKITRERWPGQRQSLDAVCDRLGVDRTARQHHGAVLDAHLLAECYLAMQRGQGVLFGEGESARSRPQFAEMLGQSDAPLPVVLASQEEASAHDARMRAIEKKADKQTCFPSSGMIGP